ncbi:hypothetical protein ACTA71_004458 [Dictyostelium dimigraforme]
MQLMIFQRIPVMKLFQWWLIEKGLYSIQSKNIQLINTGVHLTSFQGNENMASYSKSLHFDPNPHDIQGRTTFCWGYLKGHKPYRHQVNLATPTQSGRYCSIETRAIATSLFKQSSNSILTKSYHKRGRDSVDKTISDDDANWSQFQKAVGHHNTNYTKYFNKSTITTFKDNGLSTKTPTSIDSVLGLDI